MFCVEKFISVVEIYGFSTSLCFCVISKCCPSYMVCSEVKYVLKADGFLIWSSLRVWVVILCTVTLWVFLAWGRPILATHSSTLAWKIPWTEEPGRLQSMGSRRVRHDWATSLLLFTLMHWRRKWQPTPVFLPGESQGRQNLVGCHLWGRTELDTTEVT